MFQDEARFGRMVRIRRCWAEKPMRPTVCNGYEREFLYVYGAVSPMQGQLDWMIAGEMNAARMNEFLAQVNLPSGVPVSSRLLAGEPASALLAEMKKGEHDLVVLSTHGRTGLAHLLLGSIAEKLVRLSPIPVLTVPNPARA